MLPHLLQFEKKKKKLTEPLLRKFHLSPLSVNFDLKMDLNRSKMKNMKKKINKKWSRAIAPKKVPIKFERNSSSDFRDTTINGRTDGRTDRRTDTPSYRVVSHD